MIENALVFALGALAAGLLALVLFPAFTRRAARLARRDYEASLPRSLTEIAAARDGVKAAYAARIARVEHDLAEAKRALTEERTARTADKTLLDRALIEAAAKTNAFSEAEARTEALKTELRARDESLARIGAERREMERLLQTEAEARRAAERRAEEAASIATDLRLALAAAEARGGVHDGGPETLRLGDGTALRLVSSGTPGPAAIDLTGIPAIPPPTRDDALAFGMADPGSAALPAGTDANPAPTGPAAALVTSAKTDPIAEDPAERARRVEDLARRLKALKRRNSAARGRGGDAKKAEPSTGGGTA